MVFFWMEAQEDWQAQMVLRELLAQREKFSIDLYGLCELLSKGCNLQTTVAFTHTVHDVLSCAKILEVFLFALFYSVKHVHILLHTHTRTHCTQSLCSRCTFRTLSVFDLGDGKTTHSCFDVLHNGMQLSLSPRSPGHCVRRYHIYLPGKPSCNRNHSRGKK